LITFVFRVYCLFVVFRSYAASVAGMSTTTDEGVLSGGGVLSAGEAGLLSTTTGDALLAGEALLAGN